MRLLIVLAALSFGLAGPAHAGVPAWKGLIQDSYDGRIDSHWPCAAYRDALDHVPVDLEYSTLRPDLERHLSGPACTRQTIARITAGPRSSGRSTQTWLVVALTAVAFGTASLFVVRRRRHQRGQP